MHGRPVTQPDVGSLEGPPLVAGDLLHPPRRIIDASWNETQRRGNALAAQAVLFALVDFNDGRSRGPGSLLRRRPKIIVRSAYSHAVAHPRADYLGRAVRARAHDGGPLDEVKGSVLGAVQTESVGVAPVVASEIIGVLFVMVRFPVSVLIMEDGDLSPVENEDSILVDMNSDRLVEARCEPLPSYVLEIVRYSPNQPYVSGQGGHDGVSVGKKVHRAELHDRLVRVVVGHLQGIHHVVCSRLGFPKFAGDLQDFFPTLLDLALCLQVGQHGLFARRFLFLGYPDDQLSVLLETLDCKFSFGPTGARHALGFNHFYLELIIHHPAGQSEVLARILEVDPAVQGILRSPSFVLDPDRSDSVLEDDALAEPTQAEVFPRFRHFGLGDGEPWLFIHVRVAGSSPTVWFETDPSIPNRPVGKRLRIEACGEDVSVAQFDADSLEHVEALALDHVSEMLSLFAVVPASVVVIVLVVLPPVSMDGTIQSGIGWNHFRNLVRVGHVIIGLTGVELIKPRLIDFFLGQ